MQNNGKKCGIEGKNNTFILDFAVLSQSYPSVKVDEIPSHIIELDEIRISINDFKYIFYPYGNVFGINLKNVKGNPKYFPYITFLPPFRKFNGENFSLLNSLVLNIENDLGVTKNCFTTSSFIEFSKEIISLKTLCDLDCCSVISSLSWDDIVSIISNENKTRNETKVPYEYLELVLSIIFTTPNKKILETVVKFRYIIDIKTTILQL